MSKMEDKMDRALALFYKRGRLDTRQLFMASGTENIESCLPSLASEGYISITNISPIEKIYEITAKGQAFHEKGAFAAQRKEAAAAQHYDQEILDISRKTLWFARYGFWVAIISLGIAVVSILIALI